MPIVLANEENRGLEVFFLFICCVFGSSRLSLEECGTTSSVLHRTYRFRIPAIYCCTSLIVLVLVCILLLLLSCFVFFFAVSPVLVRDDRVAREETRPGRPFVGR